MDGASDTDTCIALHNETRGSELDSEMLENFRRVSLPRKTHLYISSDRQMFLPFLLGVVKDAEALASFAAALASFAADLAKRFLSFLVRDSDSTELPE